MTEDLRLCEPKKEVSIRTQIRGKNRTKLKYARWSHDIRTVKSKKNLEKKRIKERRHLV